MTSKPKIWVCNACGYEGKTSNEHLIHIAIGRVLVRNWSLPPNEVRRLLRTGHFGEFRLYERPYEHDTPGKQAWLNQEIRGLICRECNMRWARQLEEDAGKNLYEFLNHRGKIDARLFHRWAWFFATKLWFAHSRTEGLAEGPLLPVLRQLAKPDVNIKMPVYLARLDAPSRKWQFGARIRGWAGEDGPFMFWIIRGLVILVVAEGGPTVTLPVPSISLREGLRFQDVQMIKPRYVENLVKAPAATFPVGDDGGA